MEQSKPKTKLILTKDDVVKANLQHLICTPDPAQYIKFIRDNDLDMKNCLHYPDFSAALHDYQQFLIRGVASRITMLEAPEVVLKEMLAEYQQAQKRKKPN